MYNLNILAKYKFNNGYILKESALLAPFVLAGLGGNYSIGKGVADTGPYSGQKMLNPNLYGGLGINLRVSQNISLAVQSSIMLPLTDKIDHWYPNVSANKSPDYFMENSVAVYVTPGKGNKKDSDKDGVPDKLDKCPNTPPGVKVDANGCPLDSDKDGVPDYLDKCPDTPAGVKVDANGCPIDTDKDGVPDYLDECPDVFGLVALKGCPDSDGDGVPDKDDRCPNTPKGYKVDKFGCPLDSDKDGIPDSEDACPDKAGVAELKGCPFTVQAIIGKYQLSMKPIYFDFDSYKLKPDGIEALDKLANALSNHRDFGVQLDGHTDYIGTEEYNLKLSEKRANSAKGYLLNKGITDNQIRLQYFGKSKPAQDNKTREGRSLNRRVEYSLFEIGK
jgi:outer membrane protein OmpA-like peptidoglycan-associated protein